MDAEQAHETLSAAIGGLTLALDAPADAGWAWRVRQRMVAVREALLTDPGGWPDGWLAARAGRMVRHRDQLLIRVRDLGRRVVEDGDDQEVRAELLRLITDLEHHQQRLNDLVWDAVELELGGSE